MQQNKLKEKLRAGETVIGPYIRHADPGLAEILCYLGFDYLFFDGEHAPIGERECENLARVCELTGVTPIVRVPANLPWMIGRHLDTGMQGVQIPMVNSAAEAIAAVRAAKYQPLGNRGLAGARAANYGQLLPFSFPAHIEKSNAETMVIVQVETPASIEELPEIVKTPGIDVVFIGPTDLSNSLGHPGDFKHPDVQAAFDRIISIVAASDKVLGVLATTTEASLEWRARGARYLLCVFEAIMGPAIRSYLKTVREG
ncbi:MAG TPA: aldolase/citrate lyase family protein [Bryobacteraceae bacterium]|nr:aldolase/citrate lyase family protein [Bryobacteraceae bacterium]